MAQFICEYSRNIAADSDIPGLLRKANAVYMAQGTVFPTAGLRARAIEFADYNIADGADDYAFVHITLKMAPGRDEATRKRTGDAMFDMVKAHFSALCARRLIGLTMELYEFAPPGTWKHGNLHEHLRNSAKT